MKKIVLFLVLISSFAFGEYGVLRGEKTEGMYKTCYYSTGNGTRTITIGASEICPGSYDF